MDLKQSPVLHIRISDELHRTLRDRAKAEQRTIAVVAKNALAIGLEVKHDN